MLGVIRGLEFCPALDTVCPTSGGTRGCRPPGTILALTGLMDGGKTPRLLDWVREKGDPRAALQPADRGRLRPLDSGGSSCSMADGHPRGFGAPEISAFLTWLAVEQHVGGVDAEPGVERGAEALPRGAASGRRASSSCCQNGRGCQRRCLSCSALPRYDRCWDRLTGAFRGWSRRCSMAPGSDCRSVSSCG